MAGIKTLVKYCFLTCLLFPTFLKSEVSLEPFATGFDRPVAMIDVNDGSGRFFVVEQGGTIKILMNNQVLEEPLLDITSKLATGIEQGLLGFALDPKFRSNRRFFLNYTRASDGATVVASFKVSKRHQNQALLSSERIRLTIAQPFANHNGGHILFGKDGYLYVATGDGGSAGDPQNNAQNKKSLLGKILRIDVAKPTGYQIPPSNPFINKNAYHPAIYALGLRNPWRMSFDRRTHKLYLGDVGQNQLEEINIIRSGKNYGWKAFEGDTCYDTDTGCNRRKYAFPIHVYGRDDGQSVTGGYVYRGSEMPSMIGKYIFADFMTGKVWALTRTGRNNWERTDLLNTGKYLTSFAEDRLGELYLMDYLGDIWKLVE